MSEQVINHCQQWLMQAKKPAPRTCAICGLGPCQRGYAKPETMLMPEPDPAMVDTVVAKDEAKRMDVRREGWFGDPGGRLIGHCDHKASLADQTLSFLGNVFHLGHYPEPPYEAYVKILPGDPPPDILLGWRPLGSDKVEGHTAVLYEESSTRVEDAAVDAVRTLIRYIGDNPDRPGLRETPARFLKAWLQEWGRGYDDYTADLVKVFREEGQDFDEIVLVRKIKLWSHCEHHLAPFFGTADIGYLPNPKVGIIGISKIPRILEHFARRLQVQERIGVQVADFLMEKIGARGVGVIIRATHTCMCSRGVNQQDAETITSTMRGLFLTKPEARAEFLQLTRD